jgi:hypothetical protein
MSKQQWCIDQHRNTNHQYDVGNPYEEMYQYLVNLFED